MKKLSLILALVMVFSMTACSMSTSTVTKTDPTAAPVSEPAQQPAAAPVDEPADTAAPVAPEDRPVNSDPSLEALRAEMGNNLLAVSYFGALFDEVGAMPTEELAAEYGFVSNIVEGETLILPGYDCYCIVPVSPDCEVTIESYDMEKDSREVIYVGLGNPVLLRCNVSDIISNAIVTVKLGDKTLEYSPYLSLENGKLAVSDGVIDFSRYEEAEYDSVYADIIASYTTAISEKWSAADMNSAGLNFMVSDIVNAMDKPTGVGYRIIDIDKNGTDELIIASTEELDDDFLGKLVFELYTMRDGEAVQLFTSMERSRYYYAGNSDFAFIGSSSASETIIETVSLQDGELQEIPVSIEPTGYVQIELDRFV